MASWNDYRKLFDTYAPNWNPPESLFSRRAALFLRKLGEETMPMGKVRDIVFADRSDYWRDAAPDSFTNLERAMAYALGPTGEELDELLKLRGQHWQETAALADKKRDAYADLYHANSGVEGALKRQVEELQDEVKALRALLSGDLSR